MKRFLKIIILIMFLFSLFLFSEFFIGSESKKNELIFTIEKGDGAGLIAYNLKNDGIIDYSMLFRFYVLGSLNSKNLKAGDYALSPSMSISQIVNKFVDGDILKQVVTILEGYNLRDIGDYFKKNNIFSVVDLWNTTGFSPYDENFFIDTEALNQIENKYDFLSDKPKNVSLEGYIFPDTYWLKTSASVNDFVEEALNNFDKKLTLELRQEIARQNKTIFEIITAASIIEKEVRGVEDKKIVSDIFWRRLEAGIPLQSCASIVYITGQKSVEISKNDMAIDSPYNTYKYKGLPVGPICNPGMESILAAIYPTKNDYWYFLNRQDTGEAIFSRTLEEHNIAKAKYLK